MAELSVKDKEEYTSLMKLNMKRAYYSALGILGSHDDAMEASQQAFVKAYHHFGKFDRTKKFFTWYYKILRNLCLNMIRDNKHHDDLEVLEYKSDTSKIEIQDEVEFYETQKLLQEALFKLNSSDREILILKEFENYSYKEIAEMLDIPIGSVMSKLFYARKKLAKQLEGLRDE